MCQLHSSQKFMVASSDNEFQNSSTSKVDKCSPPGPAKSQIINI